MQLGIAFVSGLLFAVGLVVAGMTMPANVIGFLDLFGEWKPALAFVMVGAITVSALTYRLAMRRGAPLCAAGFRLPTRSALDARLIVGSAIFGVGWGLGGFCPGPGVVATMGRAPEALVFFVSMLAGMWLHARFSSRQKPVPLGASSPEVR